MQDRAVIFFTDGETASFAICLFRHGHQVPSLLAAAAARMTREPAAVAHAVALIGAPEYCASRFLGLCVASVDESTFLAPECVRGELEVLLCQTAGSAPALKATGALCALSQELSLEAGLIVVDVSAATWSWRAFGGYLQSRPRTTDNRSFEVHPA
jgi:hypothetical protein